MVTKFMKKAAIFSGITVVILGFILSCDNPNNPLATSLGKKVNVEPPTVTVVDPVAATYINERYPFQLQATAYRELRYIDMRILANPDTGQKEVIQRVWDSPGGQVKDVSFTYVLDTLNTNLLFDTKRGTPGIDGNLIVQFIATDANNDTGKTVDLVYFIKNKPSRVALTYPKIPEEGNDGPIPEVMSGTTLRGSVTDNRGLKPGYPMIKIWPTTLGLAGEPADDGPQGYASVFLSSADADTVTYPDRVNAAVTRVSQFYFPLKSYTVNERTDVDGNGNPYVVSRDAVFGPDLTANANYYIKIKTHDTFSYSGADEKADAIENGGTGTIKNERPIMGENEREITGEYPLAQPVDDPANSSVDILTGVKNYAYGGNPYVMRVIDTYTPPEIGLMPNPPGGDAGYPYEETPHPYIKNTNSRKIVAQNTLANPNFILRVSVAHGTEVGTVNLRWSHPTNGSGVLTWNGTGGAGGDPDTLYGNKLKYFEYNSNTASGTFKSSTQDYTLTVEAFANPPTLGPAAIRQYYVTMDGTSPMVNIRSIRAFSAPPSPTPVPQTVSITGESTGGTNLSVAGNIVDSPYTVNGNIWVTVDRSDNSGILSTAENAGGWVRYYVEETNPGDFTTTTPGSLLALLKDYKSVPTYAKLQTIRNYTPAVGGAGWVSAPGGTGTDEELSQNNFKYRATNGGAPRDIWLYVVAQDNVNNLGFVLQKINVDDSTDTPRINKDVLNLHKENASGTTIAGPADLNVKIDSFTASNPTMSNNWDSSTPSRNILEGGEGITLNFTDDHGIIRQATTTTGTTSGIYIRLTDFTSGTAGTPVTLSNADIAAALPNGGSTDWSGTLTQQIMARALGQGATATQLRNGIYRIEILLRDDASKKVSITGAPAPTAATSAVDTYYFAVYNTPPEITVEWKYEVGTPLEGSLQSDAGVDIHGTVTSEMLAQWLRITFTPNVVTNPYTVASSAAEHLTLYRNRTRTGAGTGASPYVYTYTNPVNLATELTDTQPTFGTPTANKYTYYWHKDGVVFDRTFDVNPYNISARSFTVEVYDRLGKQGSVKRTVQVDSRPPDVSLISFNYDRDKVVKAPDPNAGDFIVNGKVPFTITVTDDNGLADTGPAVKWWLLPKSAAGPVADGTALGWELPVPTGTGGDGGSFTTAQGAGGRYANIIIYTGSLAQNKLNDKSSYTLWVMALDRAGKYAVQNIRQIYVDQESDYPEMDEDSPSPQGGEALQTQDVKIRATIIDDDGFRTDRTGNNRYVEIGFTNNAGTAPTAWTRLDYTRNQTGGIEITYTPTAAQLGADGEKFYRLRVRDEGTAETDTTSSASAKGKNPTGINAPTAATNGTIVEVTRTFPSATTSYSFYLDNAPPVINFSYTDPYENLPSYRGASFNNWNDLLAALKGTITELKLADDDPVSISYGGKEWTIPATKLATPANTYGWDLNSLPPAVLLEIKGVFDSVVDDGQQMITFTARDYAGLTGRTSWRFNKDTTGPEVRIAPAMEGTGNGDTIPYIISGDAAITGTFTDALSVLWSTRATTGTGLTNTTRRFYYGFNLAAGVAPTTATGEAYILAASGQSNYSGNWSIPMPTGLADGEHTFSVMVTDVLGNPSSPIFRKRFILDKNGPVIKSGDPANDYNYPVVLGATTYSTLSERERIFSAAGATGSSTVVFTLKGTVSDLNLSSLEALISSDGASASERVSASVNINNYWKGIPAWVGMPAGAPWNATPIWTTLSTTANWTTWSGTTGNLVQSNNYPTDPPPADTNERFTITPSTTEGLWNWEFKVLEKDIFKIRGSNTNADAIRRSITITATDKGGNKIGGDEPWYFYLDTKSPSIDYISLGETGSETVFTNTNYEDIRIEGTVSDSTRIKDIKVRIARYDYAANSGVGAYTYWTTSGGGSWVATAPAVSASPSYYTTALTIANAESSVRWVLDKEKLTAMGYPPNLFETQGKYMIDLYVIDWSLHSTSASAGNPIVTTPSDWSREFYVDHQPVTINWTESDYTTKLTKQYYNNAGLTFNIQVGNPNQASSPYGTTVYNPNTIEPISGVLKDSGNNTVADVTVTSSAAVAAAGHGDEYTGLLNYAVTVGGTGITTTPLNGTYTLVLTVTNGAGRSAATGNTYRFTLDNNAPTVTPTTPEGGNKAIAGRINIKGQASDSGGRLGAVAYNVTLAGSETAPTAFDGTTANGWHFADDASGGKIIIGSGDSATTLMYIVEGPSWDIVVPSVSVLAEGVGSAYVLQAVASTQPAVTWNNVSIGTGDTASDNVYKMVVFFSAIDEAGNATAPEKKIFWLYPEGDRPVVTISSPEVNALMNGNIRLSGMATDNERVRRVWFRALQGGSPLELSVPAYNPNNWDASVSDVQTAVTRPTPYPTQTTGGWYYANGGGSSSVAWWAVINTEGELGKNPGTDGISNITFEVIAEDAAWIEEETVWSDEKPGFTPNMISRVQSRAIKVISEAPEFSDEQIAAKASASAAAADWLDIDKLHINGRASYKVTVTHPQGLSAIWWNGVNLIGNTATYTHPGYAADLGMVNTPATGTAGTIAVKAVAETQIGSTGVYSEYTVYIDVHASLLTPLYTQKSFFHKVELQAVETSRTNSLRVTHEVSLPIDLAPPRAVYTMNPRIAGNNQPIGGEAGDLFDNGALPVGGISKVVIWFQRKVAVGTGDYVSWFNKDGPVTFEATPTATFDKDGNAINVTLPRTDQATNTSSVVIDRNDPTGSVPHHGHSVRMGLGAGAKNLETVWYAELDSTKFTDGRVIVHYMVYDKAGNSRYYTSEIMVMNHAPQIRSITLGTNIRGNNLNTAELDTAIGFSNNFATRKKGATSIFDTIRTTISGSTNKINDTRSGISEEITTGINTAVSGNVRQVDFNVRNKLMALRVETAAVPDSSKVRNFRLEYVSHATKITNLNDVKAGMVYIISEPGNPTQANWSALGAPNLDSYSRGMAFFAAVDGSAITENLNVGGASAWQLNTNYFNNTTKQSNATMQADIKIPDVSYATSENANATEAEFAYNGGAFGTTAGSSIIDFTPRFVNGEFTNSDLANYPIPADLTTTGWDISRDYSLFIVKIFDGDEVDLYADFTLLALRVNNNDTTYPYAQLYDMNPKTEGLENGQSAAVSLNPRDIGSDNRIRGGLWNTDSTGASIKKPGHIEPRGAGSALGVTSLTSAEMGGAETQALGTIDNPWANPAAFFNTDTVSGKVVLRGYVEDDQRIGRVVLRFGTTDVTILEDAGAAQTGPTNVNDIPKTGILRIPTTGTTTHITNIDVDGASIPRVYWTDTIDLNRHRVEWAYIWDTETAALSTTNLVGNVTVRASAYNANTTQRQSYEIPAANAVTQKEGSAFNSLFPINYKKYNSITVQARPYITGFMRDKSTADLGGHRDTRSLQGRYMFAQNEVVVLTGYNLGINTQAVTINVPTAATATGTNGTVTAVQATSHGLASSGNASATRYRAFTVPAAAATGTGTVRFTVSNFDAVNTATLTTNGSVPRPLVGGQPYVQPWNAESNPGTEGSDLWHDFTAVHIWRSSSANNSNTNVNNYGADYFRSRGDNWAFLNPGMTIDPSNGTLYASHNETGSGTQTNTGTLRLSANDASIGEPSGTNPYMQFIDPIVYSNVYRSPGRNGIAAQTWMVTSVIGRAGDQQGWRDLGGIWIKGIQGQSMSFYYNTGPNATYNGDIYYGESTWYNASSASTENTGNGGGTATPPTTDQFLNPHIITWIPATGTAREHIHVSYYDSKDGSIKYRYNRRNYAGTIDGNNSGGSFANPGTITTAQRNTNNGIPKMWVNLDGGLDGEDIVATTYANADIGSTAAGSIPANARVVRWNNNRATTQSNRMGSIDAEDIKVGEYNDIAVTYEGYPVIAYYDATSQRLKLAVSRNVAPVLAADWTIRDFVIPSGHPESLGTGPFVSIAIDYDAASRNVIHISALNATTGNLVYIKGQLNPGAGNYNDIQTTGGVLTAPPGASDVVVQVVDSNGNVGRWSKISLDQNGNPWIAYMDVGYMGSKDGAKVAYYNSTAFTRELHDVNGTAITGWETMHVPAGYNVENPITSGRENGRLGLECFPTRNFTPTTNNRNWSAAVSYYSTNPQNRYRIAYYVK